MYLIYQAFPEFLKFRFMNKFKITIQFEKNNNKHFTASFIYIN